MVLTLTQHASLIEDRYILHCCDGSIRWLKAKLDGHEVHGEVRHSGDLWYVTIVVEKTDAMTNPYWKPRETPFNVARNFTEKGMEKVPPKSQTSQSHVVK